MRKLAQRGWLGITWPARYGGQDGEGFYEYLLNEMLSAVGAPQLGKGTGVVGKTLIRVGSEKLKREFLPKILAANRVRARLYRAFGGIGCGRHAPEGTAQR